MDFGYHAMMYKETGPNFGQSEFLFEIYASSVQILYDLIKTFSDSQENNGNHMQIRYRLEID